MSHGKSSKCVLKALEASLVVVTLGLCDELGFSWPNVVDKFG